MALRGTNLMYFSITDEVSEMTEQTKINISPFLFAIMVPVNKEDDTNASN